MSGNVSISGLVSNLDTDSIVSQLVSAYSIKKDNYVKAQTKLEWKQDAWKTLNTKIYDFYSKQLSPMRFSNAFSKMSSSINSTKATVTASSSAVSGTQKLKINQLATSGYLTGAVVKKSNGTEKVTGYTKLSDIGISNGSSISVSVGGKETTVTLNGSTTINETIAKLKDAGVNANFDENNQRFFVSSKKSGAEGDFSITANNMSGLSALSNLGLSAATEADVEKYRNQANLTDEDIAKLVSTEYTKKKTALYDLSDTKSMDELKKDLKSQIDAANTMNDKLAKNNAVIDYKFEALEEVRNMPLDERANLMSQTNEQIDTLKAKIELTEDEQSQLEELQAKAVVYKEAAKDTFDADKYSEDLTKEKENNTKIIAENAELISDNTSYLSDDEAFTTYVNGLNDDITAANTELEASIKNFYETQRSNAEAYINAYDIVNNPDADKNSDEYKNAVSLVGSSTGIGTGAVRITGQDAQIELNGAIFNSTSNNFQVNGLTISANELTEDGEEISITTDTDTKGIYDMVKNFFTEYNNLVKEMDTLYSADSAKGYEPLTDDEKESMSDKEVEKWEEKIKASLLRRDSTLETVSQSIKNAFQKSYEIDGKTYSLSSFGIKTGGYFTSGDGEKSMYHIDGNSEDGTSSGNKDKLLAAITADPDKVTQFFNELAKGVYDELSNKMKTSTLSSAYTVYNDKSMKKEYDEYKDTISTWEDKIAAYEEKYRKQFTAMEKALSTLNSNSSSLSGLLGS